MSGGKKDLKYKPSLNKLSPMLRKKKVLILTRLNPKKFGSFEEFLLFLSEALINKGCEVFLAFSSAPRGIMKDKLQTLGVHTVVFDFKNWSKIRTTLAMAYFLLKIKPSVIVTSFIGLYHPILFLARIIANPRLIYVFHSINTSDWKLKVRTGLLRTTRKATVPISLWLTRHSVDIFVSVSNFVQEEAIKLYKIPKEKAIVIHNGLNLNRFTTIGVGGNNSIKILGIDLKDGEVIITVIANLIEAKGVQILLQAFNLLIKLHNNARLVIVGDGPFMGNLKCLVEEMKLDGNVVFTGIRNDVEKILAVSDVVVVPSICDEAFPYAVLEALASGRPVVGSSIGGIPEQIKHGVNGFLFPPGDSESLFKQMMNLLENPAERDIVGNRARESAAREFTIEKQIEQYLDVMGIN